MCFPVSLSVLRSHVMKELIATERIYVDELLSVLLVSVVCLEVHMVELEM